jgi:hypothetical protein
MPNKFSGIIASKKVISRLPKVPESLGLGVMEYWGVAKKRHRCSRHCSNTPKLIEIESYHDGLPSFGL